MAISFSITLSSSSFLSKPTSKLGARGFRIMDAVSTIKVVPSVVVGGGRMGRALMDMGNGEDVIVKRGEPVPLDFAGPILVCTRNDDLEAVLEATPPSRWGATSSF